MNLRVIQLDDSEKNLLKYKVQSLSEVSRLSENPKLFAKVIALGIHQEIGTIHDELGSFVFHGENGRKLPNGSLSSEMVQFNDFIGVRIWSKDTEKMEIRVPGIRDHFHPTLSQRNGEYFKSVVTFPEISMHIAAMENFELVFVKPWAINTIFGGFDPSKPYYEGNMWEFVNLDSLRYSKLLEHRQVAYLGTHDIVSHIAGAKAIEWPKLQSAAKSVRQNLEDYYGQARANGSPLRPAALVIPHLTGLILDDLAQPMNYNSESRWHSLELLLSTISTREIDPETQSFLLKYPDSVKNFIDLARSNSLDKARALGKKLLSQIIAEIKGFSFNMPQPGFKPAARQF